MKMRTVKKLPRFTIIYMHDPFKCVDCIDSEQYSDVFTDSDLDIPEEIRQTTGKKIKSNTSRHKKSIRKISVKKLSSLSSKKNIQKECSNGLNFKKQFFCKNRTKCKSKLVKSVSCISSVIKTKKNKGVRKPSVKKNSTKCDEKKCMKEKKNFLLKKTKRKLDKNVDATKPPGKGTLKRKRWFFDKMNTFNQNYEDDIFENEKFNHFQDLIDDDTDSIGKYEDLQTPVFPFSISPREESPSPTYKDCYSPTELTESRKGAEEYRFRRGKMKKGLYNVNRDNKRPELENKPDVQKTLEAVVEILNKTQKMLDKSETDSDEDSYFPDLFEPPSVQSCN